MPGERSCAACRTKRAKPDLIRFVRDPSGRVQIDRSGTSPGRGAYTCRLRDCFDRALKRGLLARSLRTGILSEDAGRLTAEAKEYLLDRDV